MGGETTTFDWLNEANCKNENTSSFYAIPKTDGYADAVKEAKAICEECHVLEQCLDYAMRNEPFGIWGGMTESQRARHRQKLRVPVNTIRVAMR